jgi:RNA polymerase sigma-70 factor (ECF subfamily)
MIQLATAETDVATATSSTSSADLDQTDVAGAREGDPAAAERLYRRHRTRVLNLARYVAGNRRDAEDICQETFVRALGGLKGFRGEASFSTWLCRITVNQARNTLARSRTRQRLELVEPDGAPDPRPVAQRSTAELRVALTRAMSRLSEGQREVLICHDVLGMKHEEIAYVLGCAAGTSKAQLHKARLRMRDLLSPRGEE